MQAVGSGGSAALVGGGTVAWGNVTYTTPNTYASIATGYANIDSRTPAITVGYTQPLTDARTPGVYTQNTGSGSAFNVVPPFQAVNYIIRFQ